MRRKIIVLLVASCLAISCFASSLAERNVTTNRRPLTEFCELYMKRIMEFNANYGQNTGGLNSTVWSPLITEGYQTTYFVGSKGGTLEVYKSDLTIKELYTTIMDLNADEQEGHNVVLEALISISALEMDDTEADLIELYHEIDKNSPENVIMKYLDEYTNIIHPALSSNVKKLESGEEILVYQGNYDYYVEYRHSSEKENRISLCAKERQ